MSTSTIRIPDAYEVFLDHNDVTLDVANTHSEALRLVDHYQGRLRMTCLVRPATIRIVEDNTNPSTTNPPPKEAA